MKENIACLSVIVIFSIVLVGCARNTDDVITPISKNSEIDRETIFLKDTFYDKDLFIRAVTSANLTDLNSKVIIVPHHLLASEIIANLFLSIKKEGIDTVVIIGPNHEDNNASTIGTAHLTWHTPFREVKTNTALVDSFSSYVNIHPLPEAFIEEHSIGAIIPFVRYYLPNAQVVPIIFNSTASLSDSKSVAQWLVENVQQNTLVIVSTDFSHYLTEQDADINDKITKDLILNYEVEKIIELNNDYIDSPASLVSAMIYAKESNLIPNILYNKNSNDFSERPFVETTSYFGIAFTEK